MYQHVQSLLFFVIFFSYISSQHFQNLIGWACGLMAEHLPSTHKALGSSPRYGRNQKILSKSDILFYLKTACIFIIVYKSALCLASFTWNFSLGIHPDVSSLLFYCHCMSSCICLFITLLSSTLFSICSYNKELLEHLCERLCDKNLFFISNNI